MAITFGSMREPLLRSPPLLIQWCGFEGFSWVMERCGWEFAVDMNPSVSNTFGQGCAVYFKHREAGWSGRGYFDQRDAREVMYGYRSCSQHGSGDPRHEAVPVRDVRVVADPSRFVREERVLGAGPWYESVPVRIDAQPEYTMNRPKNPFDVFKTWAPQSEEIIVEPATVASLLEQIKQMQSPELARIREDSRKREKRDGPVELVHAQILSFG